MQLQPRPPDPVNATNILRPLPAQVKAMSGAFEKLNQKRQQLPFWREHQTLKFLKYVGFYASDLMSAYGAGRIDSVAQATRNFLELSIWTEFCEKSEVNAQRFWEDAARDMRDFMEAVQSLYVSVNKQPEARLADMIDGLKADAASKFNIQDVEAEFMLVNNAAGVLGKQLAHAKFYKAASKFAHPTALLFCMKEPVTGLVDSLYEIGAKSSRVCLGNVERTIKAVYSDFQYE